MLNGNLRKSAVKEMMKADDIYKKELQRTKQVTERLHLFRLSSSKKVIGSVEGYVNSLANRPKEFDRSFSEFKVEYRGFKKIINEITDKAKHIDRKTGGIAVAGVAAGAGVGVLAPTAAMGVATTFGVASTGTAISSLWGVAATNAALAWLGGGALASGGGGMAAGAALLALAGPVGWIIGITILVWAAMFARFKNKRLAEEADTKRREIEVYTAQFKTAQHEIGELYDLTNQQVQGMMQALTVLQSNAPTNYQEFSPDQKNKLAAIINHVYSLSVLLNKKVEA